MKNAKERGGYDWEHTYQTRAEGDRELSRFQNRKEALRGMIGLLLIWAALVWLGVQFPALGDLLSGGYQWPFMP
jgi:hypothetical protein